MSDTCRCFLCNAEHSVELKNRIIRRGFAKRFADPIAIHRSGTEITVEAIYWAGDGTTLSSTYELLIEGDNDEFTFANRDDPTDLVEFTASEVL